VAAGTFSGRRRALLEGDFVLICAPTHGSLKSPRQGAANARGCWSHIRAGMQQKHGYLAVKAKSGKQKQKLCDYSAFSVCFRFRFVSQIFASEIEGKRTRKRKRKPFVSPLMKTGERRSDGSEFQFAAGILILNREQTKTESFWLGSQGPLVQSLPGNLFSTAGKKSFSRLLILPVFRSFYQTC